jgi:hypothetical protein
VTLIDTGTRADPLDAAVAALTPAQRKSFLSLSYFSQNALESVNRSIVYSNGYSILNDLATGPSLVPKPPSRIQTDRRMGRRLRDRIPD